MRAEERGARGARGAARAGARGALRARERGEHRPHLPLCGAAAAALARAGSPSPPPPPPPPGAPVPSRQDGNPGRRQPSGDGVRHTRICGLACCPHGSHRTGENGRGHACPRRKASIWNGLR